MKKITLLTLMSFAFFLSSHAQVDELLPTVRSLKSNPEVSDITKLKKDFLLKLKLNEKNLNFNQPVLRKISQLEVPSFTKSIPITREFSKNSKKDIPSVTERRNSFYKKRGNRSTEISKSNSNASNYNILNISIDALKKLDPYSSIYANDLIKLEEVESVGYYLDKYFYYEDGSIEYEYYYNYDEAAGNYSLTSLYYNSNSYDANGNLSEVYFYRANLTTQLYELEEIKQLSYFNNFIDEIYTYDSNGSGLYRNSIYVDAAGTSIENSLNYNINAAGTQWVYSSYQTFIYNENMLLEEDQVDYWSEEDQNFLESEAILYLYNSENLLGIEIYYQYDTTAETYTPIWREDFTYHQSPLQEKILETRTEYEGWDGQFWNYDYLTNLPVINRGYGRIVTIGEESDWDSSIGWVDESDVYQIYSYTPPATITPGYTETFDTFLPEAWEVAQGDYGSPTGVSTTFISWDFGNNSNSPNGKSAVINIYGNNVSDYLFSPVFDLSDDTFFLNYDVALTDWNTTNSTTLGADDYVAILVTQNRGDSWVELYRWGANTEISNEGQSATEISLTGYGAEVQFAFYVNSGVEDIADTEFFIDNFQITSETLSTSTNTLEGFTLYPTIVKEALNFRSQNKVEAITVFNLLGQKVFSGAPNTNNSSINLSKLRPGVYVVKVSAEGKIGSYKIIKE